MTACRVKAWTSRKGKSVSGGTWKKTDVHQLLTNRRLLGEVVHKGEIYPGEHEAIIARKAWDRVQRILAEN